MTESVIYKNLLAGAEQQGDDDKDYKEEKYLGNYLRFKMKREGKRFWAGDNISEYIDNEHVKEQLIDEAAEAFETVLDRLLIDR